MAKAKKFIQECFECNGSGLVFLEKGFCYDVIETIRTFFNQLNSLAGF
jgi:hypothetical protein